VKNKTAWIIVLIVGILSCVFVLKNRTSKYETKQKAPVALKKLPVFEFYNLDARTTFSNKNIDQNKRICVVYFDPDCDYCENEISSIVKNISSFNGTEILLKPTPFAFKVIFTFNKISVWGQ
jgi:hypothetical protein